MSAPSASSAPATAASLGLSGGSVTLAGSSTPVAIYSATPNNSNFVTLGQVTLKGGSVAPDSVLDFSGLFNFSLPNNGGRSIIVRLAGLNIGQSFPTATMGSLSFRQSLYVAPDLQSVDLFTQSLNDVTSPAAGQGMPYSAHISAKTTLAIDLTQDQVFQITTSPQTGDIAELSAWSLVNHRFAIVPNRSFAPSNALACFGDSLTNGTGAVTPAGGWPSQLRIARAGQAVSNLGIGGQTSAQITARVLADRVRGRFWNCIFWMGRNDVGLSNLTPVVTGNLAKCVANLAPGVKYLVGTVIPAASEGPGSPNWTAIAALNTALKAAYGSAIADMFAALTANGTAQIPISLRAVTASTTGTWSSGSTSITVASATGLSVGQWIVGVGIPDQTTVTAISGTAVTLSAATTAAGSGAAVAVVGATEIHLNDAGYTIVRNTISSAMTSNGM